jgi:Holliday junction resolvase
VTDIGRRNKANRAKGARWQSDLRNGLRNQGFDVERLALSGKEDEGDHVIRGALRPVDFIVIEAKAAVMNPSEFVRQAVLEADHFTKHRGIERERALGIAVVKRERMHWSDAYVLTSLGELLGINK